MDSWIASADARAVIGKASIVRALYEGRDLGELWEQLMLRVSEDMSDAAAFMDLSSILYGIGRPEEAAISQKAALSIARSYRIKNGKGTGLRILAFVTAGDFMANTPIEFLLEHSRANILLHYVDRDTATLDDVPEHDVAFVAVAESPANLAVLKCLEQLLVGWSGPMMNNAPARVVGLARDSVAQTLRDEPSILAPPTIRVSRDQLKALAEDKIRIDALEEIRSFPIIVRPSGTHAGNGLEKISAASELGPYLETLSDTDFFVAPFIDYSGVDGKFRKQRIAFIDGQAFASHLAVSDHWMVHYLSAGMAEHEERRAEEASWMAHFDSGFATRHARAFDALHRHFGLDYFAIDCAELSDGRLLIFEADIAMIVHSMDSRELFPYKTRPMRKLFQAFEKALTKRVERGTKSAATPRCAHTGRPVVYQRTDNDCLICSLAMLTGRSYDEIEQLARQCDASFPAGGPMSHSIMRGVADKCGFVLLSSIYMLWTRPAIIGLVSPTIPNTGHAVFWDGEKIIDPGLCERVDRAYVDRCGLEFTQSAGDLEPLLVYEPQISYTAGASFVGEPL